MTDNNEILQAMKLQRNGHHTQAAAAFQTLGNKERPVVEKQELWAQAQRSRDIYNSD